MSLLGLENYVSHVSFVSKWNRLLIQLLNYKLRFNTKGKRLLSFIQETLQLSQNYHSLIPRNLMARHTNSILGSPQLRQRYTLIAKQ
jgi:hypothetical protein